MHTEHAATGENHNENCRIRRNSVWAARWLRLVLNTPGPSILLVFLLIAAQLLADGPAAKDPAFWIVRDGKPAATIVIAAESLKSNRYAAEELQHFFEEISGALVAIATDEAEVEGPKILIGRSKPVEALRLQIPSGFTRNLKEEGFIIKTVGEALVLVGNDGGPKRAENPKQPFSFGNTYKGSLFAVYELLERLGCRWYYPGEIGEIVPKGANVSVPKLDFTQKPSFPVRGFWFGIPGPKRKDKRLRRDMDQWFLRNRYLPYSSVLASASDGSIMRPFKTFRVVEEDGKKKRVYLFEDHPEYFAMRKDGTRHKGYLCLANPEVLKIATEYALDHFRKKPDSMCFGYAPPDGAPTCECPECYRRNLDFMQKPPANPRVQDISEGFYWFLNEVAKGVEKEFPDKWITTTAYSGRIRPPEGVELNRSVSVHTAFLAHSRHHRYDFNSWQTKQRLSLYKRWGQMMPYAVERPYFPVMQFHCNVPLPLYRANAFNINAIRGLGFAGSEWEGRCSFMVGGLNLHVRARALWNADTDIDALLEEFYGKFYGAAAEPVRDFYEAVEKQLTLAPVDHHEEERIPDIYPYDFVVRVTDAVGDIEKFVAGAAPATQQRVRLARLIIDHFRAHAEMRRAEAQVDFALAARKAREMIEQEKEIDGIHPALLDGYGEVFDSRALYGEFGANASPHGKLKQYVAKQALVDGTKGDLVAALPVEWDFRADPNNEGVVFGWPAADSVDGNWRKMKTTQCWEMQGLQDEEYRGYNGLAWYRTKFSVPAKFKGRRIALFIGGLNNQAWVWLNGKIAGTQPYHEYWQRWKYHHQLDLTERVRYGEENSLAIRIKNDQNFGGIFRRCFVYAPIGEPEK